MLELGNSLLDRSIDSRAYLGRTVQVVPPLGDGAKALEPPNAFDRMNRHGNQVRAHIGRL